MTEERRYVPRRNLECCYLKPGGINARHLICFLLHTEFHGFAMEEEAAVNIVLLLTHHLR